MLKINRYKPKVVLSLLFSLSIPFTANAQITADGTEEAIQELSPLTTLESTALDCNVDTNVVAWETSNGGTTSDHTVLVGDLQTAGYTVRSININTDGIPACVDTLVITSQRFNACLITPYSAENVALIKAAVQNGLALFLLNEWGYYCGQGTAPIANVLDAIWGGNNYASQAFLSGTHFDPNNPALLFNGVTSWRQFAGSDYITTEGVVVTTNRNTPAMIAKPIERGCAVITGDSNWIANRWIGYNNNRTLASNVINFLHECASKVIDVSIDIKPGSDPNCINNNGHGVIPVAILGSGEFDVAQIDHTSLLLDGMAVRVRAQKGPQCSTQDVNGDGYFDLVCQFEDQADNWVEGTDTATVTGSLLDNSATIEGTDSICIVP